MTHASTSQHHPAKEQPPMASVAVNRAQEKRWLAQRNYRLARKYLERMDYSSVVDLMREAVRLYPQAEYFALLARAQGENPYWREDAIESYRSALRLKPQDAMLHVALGQLLEKAGRPGEARQAYGEALEAQPGHVLARDALDRLEEAWLHTKGSQVAGKLRGFFKS